MYIVDVHMHVYDSVILFNLIHVHVDHQNFFGIDENIGPIAISLKRERIPDEVVEFYGIMGSAPKYQHRVIVRTSQVRTCICIYYMCTCYIVSYTCTLPACSVDISFMWL